MVLYATWWLTPVHLHDVLRYMVAMVLYASTRRDLVKFGMLDCRRSSGIQKGKAALLLRLRFRQGCVTAKAPRSAAGRRAP